MSGVRASLGGRGPLACRRCRRRSPPPARSWSGTRSSSASPTPMRSSPACGWRPTAASRSPPSPFVRAGDGWTLRMPAPALDRFEYALAVQRADGSDEHWTDPANPLRAPGAFGEKSVVQLPGYAEPAWLAAERVPGATDALTVASSALGAELQVTLWRPDDAPRRRAPAAARRPRRPRARPARAAHRLRAPRRSPPGALPRHRVALLAPGDRDQWYSASALYARTLATRVLPGDRRRGRGARPVGAGVSLGALAMLHAQRRFPDAFAGLFLQSGSFFMPRFDAQESRLRALPADRALRPRDVARAAAAHGAGGA